MKRRTVLKLLSSTAALRFAGTWPLSSRAQARGRVVVVGGGFGGATAARYLRLIEPSIRVTLVEPGKQYITLPMSNDYIAGERDFASRQHPGQGGRPGHRGFVARPLATAPSLLNACFSLIGPSWGISVAAVYEVGKDNPLSTVKGAGGVSPLKAGLRHRRLEAIFCNS